MDFEQDKKTLRKRLKETIAEIEKLGGWTAFKSGDWLHALIQNSFSAYYKNANAEYFRRKYPKASDDTIIRKLISVSARNAAILGALTGASISANEISAIVTATPTGGLNLPAQLTIAAGALGAEAILLVRIQLQLIANIAKLLEVPLDPEDPEDVLLVLAFAIGGFTAQEAGKFAAKAGGHLAKVGIRKHVSGATLQTIKQLGAKLGVKILQRSIVKYTVPALSVLVGGGWNHIATRTVGKVATRHLNKVKAERSSSSTA